MPRKNNRVKETSGSKIFAGLTRREADILRSKLGAGKEMALSANGEHASHDFFMETCDIMHDLHVVWMNNG
jgi:hypothetical protein